MGAGKGNSFSDCYPRVQEVLELNSSPAVRYKQEPDGIWAKKMAEAGFDGDCQAVAWRIQDNAYWLRTRRSLWKNFQYRKGQVCGFGLLDAINDLRGGVNEGGHCFSRNLNSDTKDKTRKTPALVLMVSEAPPEEAPPEEGSEAPSSERILQDPVQVARYVLTPDEFNKLLKYAGLSDQKPFEDVWKEDPEFTKQFSHLTSDPDEVRHCPSGDYVEQGRLQGLWITKPSHNYVGIGFHQRLWPSKESALAQTCYGPNEDMGGENEFVDAVNPKPEDLVVSRGLDGEYQIRYYPKSARQRTFWPDNCYETLLRGEFEVKV